MRIIGSSQKAKRIIYECFFIHYETWRDSLERYITQLHGYFFEIIQNPEKKNIYDLNPEEAKQIFFILYGENA